MSRYHAPDDEPFDDRDDPLDSDQEGSDFEEELDTEPCPFCGKPVVEEADLCPHCGGFISRESKSRSRSVWFWVAAIAALLGIVGWKFLALVGFLSH